MDWPDDADGDLMRHLQGGGFDFARAAEIDFNIDFDDWPPDSSIIPVLRSEFPGAEITAEEEWVTVKLTAFVTYPFVVAMQADLTRIAAAYGGRCESWGILWTPGESTSKH